MNNRILKNPVLSGCHSRDSDTDTFLHVLIELILFMFMVLVEAAVGVRFQLNNRTIR